MNGNCQTCPVESQCAYPYKPTDCCDQRKFRPMKAATTMPNSLDREAFEAAYAAIHPITPTKETAWICWQAGAAAEREICAKLCESLWRIDGQFTADEFANEIRDRSAP